MNLLSLHHHRLRCDDKLRPKKLFRRLRRHVLLPFDERFIEAIWLRTSNNLESLKDELVLRQCTSLVTEHVVQLCEVFMQVKVLHRTRHQVAFVFIKDSHLNVVLKEINVEKLAHFQTNRQIKRNKRVVKQEKTAERLQGLDFGRVRPLKNIHVLVHMAHDKQIIEVREHDSEREHKHDVDEEDLVDDLIDVRLLEPVFALIQD